ncbi:MAG: entericidin [Alphaproteobacteria bacterium PA2]|nr:MAG: entericidin [Alphaproteobacteria bacterium PA2]
MARPSLKTLIPLVAVLAFGLTACNTIKGAGRDVSATGKAVSDAAATTQQDMKK